MRGQFLMTGDPDQDAMFQFFSEQEKECASSPLDEPAFDAVPSGGVGDELKDE